jgi:hypothetical protein
VADVGSYSRSKRLRKPSETRFDRFAIFQVAREHDLTALDAWVLTALTMLCDWRDKTWCGTVTELALDVRGDRRAVRASLDRLAAKGLIRETKPFAGGPKVNGCVIVVAVDQLLTGTSRRDRDDAHVQPFKRADVRGNIEDDEDAKRADVRECEDGMRAELAHDARSTRAVLAQNGADTPGATSEDAHALREQGRTREEGKQLHDEDNQLNERLERAFDDGGVNPDGTFGDSERWAIARAAEAAARIARRAAQ